ncbi:MAG: AMP-binding protein, partial [Proteiniphilum sp.]
MIWNPQRECADRQQMQEMQGSALQAMIRRIYNHVPFYRNRLMALGIEPGDITSVEQLRLLPFTTKADLRDNYPFGLFTMPQSEVVRIHASSGTTGKPTVVGYSRADIELWAEVVARSLTMAGIHSGDTIQVAYGYGPFTGGLGLHYGAEKIGATVIPISTGNTKKQLQFMTDFRASVLACTPSYAAHLGESILKEGISPDEVRLRIGVFGAEPWTGEMRREIEKLLRIKAYDIYGLSEVIGPGVSMECECQCGNHVFEDHFI